MSIQVGRSLLEIADVNIKRNEVTGGNSEQLFPSGIIEQPMGHLLLKPLSHFNYESIDPNNPQQKRYVLNINVLTKVTHLPDPAHAISLRTVGKTAMIFINYMTDGDGGADTEEFTYLNYRYRIQFKSESTPLIKGKELVVITASGDPEEGSASKIIVEDEDEI